MGTAIPPQAVRESLERILASEGFVRSGRMRRFLEFVVEEALAGRSDQLGEYGIGIAVFDRGPDFEPALDPIVRNDARRLRLKLLEYYRQADAQAAGQVRIEIPKGGYRPVFFPISSCSPSEGASPAFPRRLAVLPFEVLSASPESAMHGRALCLSLTASLTNLRGLETVAHTYLREQPIREAASELRLSHVIHGSVLESSDRCRVIINLIRVPDGTQVWAREYDFESSRKLAVHSEIAGQVRREIGARLDLPPAAARLAA